MGPNGRGSPGSYWLATWVCLLVVAAALPGAEQLVDLVLHLLHLDGGDGCELTGIQ